MKPWKRLSEILPFSQYRLLQWGHGDEAVEEVGRGVLADRRRGQLQWGHGDEAVEETMSTTP